MRKHKGLWVLAWFSALLIFNLWRHWTPNVDKGILYSFLEALSYLTTPVELALSALMVCMIVTSGKMKFAVEDPLTSDESSSPRRTVRHYTLTTIAILAIMTGFGIFWLSRTKHTNGNVEQQRPQAPNGSAAYELLTPATGKLGSVDDGLTPKTKQRMRESLALQLSGLLQKQNNPMRVDVIGNDHDVLFFQLASMNERLSDDFINELARSGDGNFWNAMRLMNYNEIVFSGDSYNRIISRKEFLGFGKDYDSYKAAFLKAMKGLQAGAQGELAKP